VDPKTSSRRPKVGPAVESSPRPSASPQPPQNSLSTAEIKGLVKEVLEDLLEPAITRVLSAAIITKKRKARKKTCPLSDALQTSVRSILENDPEVLATIKDRLGTTEEQDETITQGDTVELIRGECLALMRGFSKTAQVPEAAPPRQKRRKRQESQPTWWEEDTQRLSGELRQCVTAQVKQQLDPVLDALMDYLEAQGSVAEPPKSVMPPQGSYWSPQLVQQQGLPSQLPVYTAPMTFPPQQSQQVPSQNFAAPGFPYCLPYSTGQQPYSTGQQPYSTIQHVPVASARPQADALQAATLLQVLRALRD
jgi:hypothetical protein